MSTAVTVPNPEIYPDKRLLRADSDTDTRKFNKKSRCECRCDCIG